MNPTVVPISSRSHSLGYREAIGEILVRTEKLTLTDVERISNYQKEHGMLFGEAAQSLGLISEADVRKGLAKQYNFSVVESENTSYPFELVAAYQPDSEQVEVMRSVRSDLLLRWFNKGHKSIVIASINPGDGNSFFTANLGLVFSQIGKRTLLMDANLRNPRLHEIFGLSAKQGLSDLLSGRAATESIEDVTNFPDLHVLPAGAKSPNAQELLSHARVEEIHKNVVNRFDVTLIDASSLKVGADALLMAEKADGLLLLIRKNKTKMSDIEAVGRQLSRYSVELVGSVLVDF